MNEMQMIRDLLKEPPSPPHHVSAEALRSLENDIAGRRTRAPRLGRLGFLRRPAWGVGLVGAAAAAALVATTIATGPADHGTGGSSRQALPASEAPIVKLNARTVLLAAAERADGQPDQVGAYWHSARMSRQYYRTGPATNRYTVYSETKDEGWTPRAPGGEQWGRQQELGARPATPADQAAWRRAGSPSEFAVDVPGKSGKGGGMNKPVFKAQGGSPRVSHSPLVDGDKVFWLGRNVTMKDLRGLPTDPAKLKAWLLKSYEGHGTESSSDKMSSDLWLYTVASGLITDMPVTPKVRAAAFRMLAALKSVQAVGGLKDAAGRTGTAISIVEKTTVNGVLQHRLIIDEATGRALGSDIVIVKPAGVNAMLPAGSLLSSTTITADEWVASPPR